MEGPDPPQKGRGEGIRCGLRQITVVTCWMTVKRRGALQVYDSSSSALRNCQLNADTNARTGRSRLVTDSTNCNSGAERCAGRLSQQDHIITRAPAMLRAGIVFGGVCVSVCLSACIDVTW